MLALLLFLVTITVATDAVAQCVPGVSPLSDPRVVQAVSGQPIVVRVHAAECGVTLGETSMLEGNVLRFAQGVDSRITACPPERDLDFSLPTLPPGQYILQYEPEGISLVCYPFVRVPFGVAPAGTVSIPAIDAPAFFWLALLLLLLGWRARARG